MIFAIHITIARPLNEDDQGVVECGHYTVDDGLVSLTDETGMPIASGRLQIGYTAKVGEGETAKQVAQRLLWRFYRTKKSGGDFWRPLPSAPTRMA